MRWKTYLPRLGYIIDPLAGEDKCGLNERAAEFVRAWLRLLDERAHIMRCDKRLVQCAQDHAEYLHSRTGDQLQMSMHRGRNGSYSNQRVVESGYRLPKEWDLNKNFVESCSRSGAEPGDVAISLANHDTHHAHLFGLGNFYVKSTVYGVGNQGNDYVCVICPEAE